MSQASNYGSFLNTANPRLSAPVMELFGPSSATDLGDGIFNVTDGSTGDILFIIKGLSGETVTCKISNDGTNYSAALVVVDALTGLDVIVTDLGSGTYILPLKRFGSPRYVKFEKSATSEIICIAICTTYANPNFVGV